MFMKNIDVLTMINYFIGSFICCFGVYVSSRILLNKKTKQTNFITIIILILLSILSIVNYLTFDSVIKIFGSMLMVYLVYYLIHKEKILDSFIYCIINYIILIISEILLIIIIELLHYFFQTDFMFLMSKSIISNTIIAIFSCVITCVLRKKIIYYVEKIRNSQIIVILLEAFITIFIISCGVNYLYIDNWKLNFTFVLVVFITIGAMFLLISFLRQYLKTKEVVEKYVLVEDYLKTSADVVEKYSSTVHKYKNNLISIQGYLKTDVKQANKYVDNLLEDYKNKKYSWFSKINYIKNDVFRYLIYYKLNKAEEKNLKLSVTVSKELKKIEINYLNVQETGIVLDILGELLDNATYAASESSSKELILDIYKEDNYITIEIANTYSNDFDLNSITKSGYTTKGKGHGLGLYEIDKSVKKLDFLTINYEKVDKYFIVKSLMKIDKNL